MRVSGFRLVATGLVSVLLLTPLVGAGTSFRGVVDALLRSLEYQVRIRPAG